MKFGKVIRLFLLDGTPNGRWICELSNWTGFAYKIPRSMVKDSEDRKDLRSPGVYFLFGYDESAEKPMVYIGEAENIIKRLEQHLEKKDNWYEAIAFLSKDDNLNKAHIKYLENNFYMLAKECGRYQVDNSNIPTRSQISESEEAEMEEFIYNTRILLGAMGHRVFEKYVSEPTAEKKESPVFSVTAGSGKAYGKIAPDGFVLLKGSKIRTSSRSSLGKGIAKKVKISRESGEIKNDILQVDKLFSSSSSAAAFAVGYSISGPQQWKTSDGETLKSFESHK